LKNIFVNNGFETPEIIEDMTSWDDAYYKKVLKGGFEEVKDTLRRMIAVGILIEMTLESMYLGT